MDIYYNTENNLATHSWELCLNYTNPLIDYCNLAFEYNKIFGEGQKIQKIPAHKSFIFKCKICGCYSIGKSSAKPMMYLNWEKQYTCNDYLIDKIIS